VICCYRSQAAGSTPSSCTISDDLASSVADDKSLGGGSITVDAVPFETERVGAMKGYIGLCSTDERPLIWNEQQAIDFRAKHGWLTFVSGKLGCTTCRSVGCLGPSKTQGIKIASEWTSCSVTYNGDCRQNQLSSLRKKIHLHEKAASHISAADIMRKAEEGHFESLVLEQKKTSA